MVAVGIDLGTTNSCVAAIQNGALRVIEDDRGWRVIPSIVTYAEDKLLVGWETFAHPDSTVYEIKRLIGQKYNEKNVQKHIARATYKVIKKDNSPHVEITRQKQVKQLAPEEVSAEVLKYLKNNAEKRLDATVTDAVITVPAYFDGSQRSSTKRAAQLAGFKNIRIINEPTAAALSFQYDYQNEKKRKVLVFDFGGGTFDVTIAEASKNSFVVLAIDGDCSLGGTDVDANFVKLLCETIKNDTGSDVKGKHMLRLRKACREAKEQLSSLAEIEIDLMNVCCREDYFVTVTKHQLEELNRGLFQRTMDIVRNCLSAAKLQPDDIDEILLVGGSTRIPKIQEMLKNTFKRSKLNSTKNPDEDVARGAAIYAANLTGFNFTDVLSLSLGIDTRGEIMHVIIPRNTQIPCEKNVNFGTTLHNITSMRLEVRQGESLVSTRNHFLYSFDVTNLKKAPRGVSKICVVFKVDTEGILTVTAEELDADNKMELQIEIIDSSVNEVNADVESAILSKEEELKFVDFARKKYEFEKYCDDLKLEYEDFGKSTKAGVIEEIDGALSKMKDLKIGDDMDLEKLSSELSTFINSTKVHT